MFRAAFEKLARTWSRFYHFPREKQRWDIKIRRKWKKVAIKRRANSIESEWRESKKGARIRIVREETGKMEDEQESRGEVRGGRDGRNRPSKPEANRVTSRSLKTQVSIRDNSSSDNENGYALVGNRDVTMREEPPWRDSIVNIYFRVCELYKLVGRGRVLSRINSETIVPRMQIRSKRIFILLEQLARITIDTQHHDPFNSSSSSSSFIVSQLDRFSSLARFLLKREKKDTTTFPASRGIRGGDNKQGEGEVDGKIGNRSRKLERGADT